MPDPVAGPQAVPITSAVPGPKPEEQRRTGVVWVHGIGTQVARETLFDWTRPVIDVLAEWRRAYDRTSTLPPIGENPVRAASVSDEANPWIEVDIPEFAGRRPARWVFTEAYWAGDVRAPSFAAAASYLLSRLPGIIEGIAEGWGQREPRRMKRLRD